jgi:hypothetical protein
VRERDIKRGKETDPIDRIDLSTSAQQQGDDVRVIIGTSQVERRSLILESIG